MLWLLLTTYVFAAESAEQEHLLAIGSMEYVKGTLQGSHVSNNSCLEVRDNFDGTLRVVAIRKGESDLFLAGDRVIHYNLVSNQALRTRKYVSELLSDVPGIRIGIVDSMVGIRGKPANAADEEKILSVQAAYVDDVLNLAVGNAHLCETHQCRHAPEPLESFALIDPPMSTLTAEDPIVKAVREASAQITKKKRAPASESNLKKLKLLPSVQKP